MKIYVVTSGEYSDYCIEAVFTDKEKAKLYCAAHEKYTADYPRIEEYDTEDDAITGGAPVRRYCEVKVVTITDPDRYYVKQFYGFARENSVVKDHFGYSVTFEVRRKTSRERAIKIAQDMIAEYKAKGEGI